MDIIRNIESLKHWRKNQQAVGFVPTMGALHAGHLSLVEAAKKDDMVVMVSIFVNPTQFNQANDLKAYPNTLDADLEALKQAGVAAVYLPDFDQVYPDGYRYQLSENTLSQVLCGAHRPGHFDGVLTVVMKLFNLVKPNRAYFGEKDHQQLQLIKGMVAAFFMDIDVVACPIVREADGLAMSSRNLRLSPEQRALAPQLHQIMLSGVSIDQMKEQLSGLGFEVDYLEAIDGRLYGAASLGAIRLIDNVPYPVEEAA